MGKQSDAELLKRMTDIFSKYGVMSSSEYRRANIPYKVSSSTIWMRFGGWDNMMSTLSLKKEPSDATELSEDYRDTSATLTSKSRNIATLDELLAYAEVDMNVWQVDRYIVNKWDMGYKRQDGTADAKPLYQVKVWLKRNESAKIYDAIRDTIEAMKQHAPSYRKSRILSPKTSGTMVEIDLADIHLAKLCWSPEVGDDYDTDIAMTLVRNAVDDLISRLSSFDIDRITLPTGNDLFHIDNMINTTTAGTRQDVDSRWQRAFNLARCLFVDIIDMLRDIAPVDVPIIPGNHDHQRMYYLGEVLKAWYHNCDNVVVDNAPTLRKYREYGAVMLGFTHGKDEKINDLPLIMAREEPHMWARTVHHEWHIGHFHRKRETKFVAGDTFSGVQVRVIPSLCATDAWHNAMGYVKGMRAAEAYLWSHDTGYIGHFSSNVIGDKVEL